MGFELRQFEVTERIGTIPLNRPDNIERAQRSRLLLEANHFPLLASTEDMREGMSAFLEKRDANFQGK